MSAARNNEPAKVDIEQLDGVTGGFSLARAGKGCVAVGGFGSLFGLEKHGEHFYNRRQTRGGIGWAIAGCIAGGLAGGLTGDPGDQ